MAYRIVAGWIAAILMLAFVGAPAVKLKDPALIAVILIGVAMMAVDLYQSLADRD